MIDAVYDALARDPVATAAREVLERAGGRVYAVGGTVRDAVLGQLPKDVDLLVAGLEPEAVEQALAALPGRVDYTGASFGVFRYRRGRREVEVALPRTERSTGERHRDFEVDVDPGLAVEHDLARRDFTANALALDLASGRLVDPFGGREDIAAGVLRTVSPQSFEDDPLRIVRALVAYARHGLEPDATAVAQMHEHAARVRHLPGERLHVELRKLLSARDPVPALRLARRADVLAEALPELDACFGVVEQTPTGARELGEHLLATLAAAARSTADPELRLAALLHDVGRPAADASGHAEAGAAIVRSVLGRLRFPQSSADRIARLVRLHVVEEFETPRGARAFLRRSGSPEVARELLLLREADLAGREQARGRLRAMRELVDRELAARAAYRLDQLAVDGDDVLALGVPEGRRVGEILDELLERVLDEPALNERGPLLELARRLV